MRVMMLEFNELSPVLMDRFIAAGHLPNFESLRSKSSVFVTDAGEEPPNLEPWIQWVTVHTGMPYEDHKCFHLNDGATLATRRIWDDVGARGGKSWVCGSMNASFDPAVFKGRFLPDPWANNVPDFPDNYFKPFNDVVRVFVQEHSGRPKVSPLAMARFGKFMVENGLSVATVHAALSQLIGERRNPSKWRRALILDRLLWDLFRRIYRREKPDFASFFINSTAHFQHFHWREMEPELFEIKPTQDDVRVYADAILDGYKNMDRIVGEAMRIASDDTAIVLCTALSQQPMLTYEHNEGRQIFRHKDIRALLAFAGITEHCEYAPVMSQEFHLHCDSEAAAIWIASRLEEIRLEDGTQVMWAYPIGKKIDAGCKLHRDPGLAWLHLAERKTATRFHDLFYPLESLRSGMHDPDGILWVKARGQVAAESGNQRVPLLAVYPTLAHLLGTDQESAYAKSLLRQDEGTGLESAAA